MKDKIQTPQDKELLLEALSQLVKPHQHKIKAVTISTPGKVDSQKGIIFYGGALAFLDGLKIKKYIYDTFKLPCAVINDGKAAALAELWLGELKGVSNGITLTLGTGLGGGIIINGNLYEGSHYQAGEFSFGINRFDETGIKEVAAQKGSAVRFVKESCVLLSYESMTDGESVFRELEKHNELIYPLFEEFCKQIAVVLINVQSVLDMEKVAIGGGISVQPILISEIINQYQKLRESAPIMKATLEELTIVPCYFKNEANLLGAVYQYLINIELDD